MLQHYSIALRLAGCIFYKGEICSRHKLALAAIYPASVYDGKRSGGSIPSTSTGDEYDYSHKRYGYWSCKD